MSRRKRWPNNCEWARLDAIAAAQQIDDLALPFLEGVSMTEVERVQRAARICRKAKEIVHMLKETRPEKAVT